MPAAWPLVGRDPVLEECGALLRRPGVAGLVLVGPAGVGKTRLLQECADRASAAGSTVRRATAHRSGRDIPFAALSALLPPEAMVARGTPLLRQAMEALAAEADGGPLVLAVDDAHLLDDASALLLHQMASEQRAFVMVTVAEGAAAPDAVVGLWRDDRAARIEVGPFDRQTTEAVLVAALEGEVGAGSVDALHAMSAGNALVLREVVRGSLAEGSLALDRGLWQLTGGIRPSARLRELVDAQVAGLEGEAREVVELLALAEPLSLPVLAGHEAAVEDLEARGMVVVEAQAGEDQVSLAHPSHSEVVRDQLPMLRARRLCAELAERIEAAGAVADQAVRLATLRLDARGIVPVELLVDAARQAYFANDVILAERLAREAEAVSPSFAVGQLRREALYRLGRAEEAATAPVVDGTVAERAALASYQAVAQFWLGGDVVAAEATLAEALASLPDGPERAELLATSATIAVNSGHPSLAMERIAGVDQRTDRPRVQAALAQGLALPHLGRGVEALAVIEAGQRAYAAAGEVDSMFQPSLLEVCRSTALMGIGELEASHDAAVAGSELARSAGDTAGEAFSAFALGRTLLAQGRVRSSLRWMREAVVVFSAIGHRGPLRWSLGGVALAAASLGDHPAAADALAQLEEVGPHPAVMLGTDIERGRAWTALAGGDPEAARTIMAAAVADARARGLVALEAHALHDLARLGRAAEAVDRLEELGTRLEGAWVPALAADVRAMRSGDAEELAASAAVLDEMGARLLAAETAARASAAHGRAGHQREAAAWRRTAAAWAEQCEGATTPALAQGDGPVPLTAREREIAVLAASGLTSKVIADRLFLSARTIDNNLARVYLKLGIADRGALAEALGSGSSTLS